MQLSSDLAEVCGEFDGKPFEDVLLEAKVNPKLQNKLRRVIDARVGQGFFYELRHAEYSQKAAVKLLEKVQGVLYTQPPRKSNNPNT